MVTSAAEDVGRLVAPWDSPPSFLSVSRRSVGVRCRVQGHGLGVVSQHVLQGRILGPRLPGPCFLHRPVIAAGAHTRGMGKEAQAARPHIFFPRSMRKYLGRGRG